MKLTLFDITSNKEKRFPILATGLAFCYLLFASLPAFRQTDLKTEQKIPENTAAENLAAAHQQDYALISELHLFGQPAGDSSSPDGLPPETELQLKLKGVFYFPNHYAHAIIETPDLIQKSYKANDTLPGGAIIKSIQGDKIILSTNNREELLILDKIKLKLATTDDTQESQPADEVQPEPETTEETETQPLE